MTIGDYIDKFFLNRTFSKDFEFTGYQITAYVRSYIPHVEEVSVLRELRKQKQFDALDYEAIDAKNSKYRIIPKRR